MNRQILFRAKRIDWRNLPKEQWWVEGDVQHTTSKNIILIVVDDYKAYPCDSSTLCQYTGLTDKNSKKIWENDILHDGERLWHVHYYKNFAMYMLRGVKHNGGSNGMNDNFSKCIVVGNIYDDTDLLEVE